MGRRKKYQITYELNQITGRRRKVKIPLIEKRKKPSKRSVRKSHINKIRSEVIKRDKGKCVRCGCRQRLHVHHKIPVSKGGSDGMENLETLCDICHMEEHRDDSVYNVMIKGFWLYEEIG